MRILFLTHRFPYPPIGGDRVKVWHLLCHLSNEHTVDVIALDEARAASHSIPGAEGIRNLTTIPFSKAKAAARILASLPTSTPIEFAYYHSPEMQAAVNSTLQKNEYDLIISFFLRTARYVANYTGAPKLLVAEDARVILQERSSERFEVSPQYLVRKIDAIKLRAYEPWLMAQGFDLVTFVSKADQERILAANPQIPTAILSNGADLEAFPFYQGEKENEIVFVGHLGIYHNVMMVERLLKDIYPIVRVAFPETRLSIVGKDPSKKLRAMIASTPGTALHADVPSVRPFIERAAVFVHPQTIGTGIQNKLLETMAIGTPVVTTSVGAAGIEGVVDGINALVRSTDLEIAEAVLGLLRDNGRAQALAVAARQLIETHYAWNNVFLTLDEIIGKLTSRVGQKAMNAKRP